MKKTSIRELISNCFSLEEINLIENPNLEKKFNVCKILDNNNYILDRNIEAENFQKSGSHRIKDWEEGWSGSGVYYSNDEYNNLPYYFKNGTHVRIKGIVYQDIDGFLEVELLRCLQEVIFNKFIKIENSFNGIFEYGCGTGSNIQYLKKIFSEYKFYGSDWAKSACDMLEKNGILEKENIFCVNYFDSATYSGGNNYIAFTNASLEQTGKDYEEFMYYLFNNKNCIGGIHIEPIREILNLNSELNKQSYLYAEKRGYLTNFFNFMKKAPIKILEAKDYEIGSKYLSGYQVLMWVKK
jgi:hypothetical protein